MALAMWHRVMTRPWMADPTTVDVIEARQSIGVLKDLIAECSFRLKVDAVVEYTLHDAKEKPWKEMGFARPIADRVWMEWNGKNTEKFPQCGMLIAKSETRGVDKNLHARAKNTDAVGLPPENSLRFDLAAFNVSANGDPVLICAYQVFVTEEGHPTHVLGPAAMKGLFPSVAVNSFAFLHCKNVKQLDITATHGPGAKWCRRQRVPEVTYKTLLIPGFTYEGRIVNSNGELGERVDESTDRRMHIVRGHFATYTADKPLFGRADTGVGKFWHPAHVRGNLKQGAVVKDYEVVPPASNN